MKISSLERLIPLLSNHGVTSFRLGDLVLELGKPPVSQSDSQSTPIFVNAKPNTKLSASIPNAPTSEVPESLQAQADELMQFDQILHWSDGSEHSVPLPLTGEDPQTKTS